ncbi:phosphotransferase [Parasphingopyxis sp. CP4]|uniref:phosphotransferase family protein n=1 Tax=Parasphingopyxis sp. CP4 TaxID=2724527 RepID=UPI00159F8D6C|nr:phosphotransferase family protein [Parasphingopyxis sp. CP4]QLC21191.1 phosphotransferase [Parasphingopyxis sp. CP4]
MSDPAFESLLVQFCNRQFGETAEISGLKRLTGGANMESWGFDYGDRELVLRRAPGSGERSEELARISMESEARLIALACEAGITAPPMLGILTPEDKLGQGYLMARITGETLPHKILGNPDFARAETALTQQCATELAKIHAMPLDTLPDDIPREDAAMLLEGLGQRYRDYGARIPVFDYALRWLADHLPDPAEPRLLHGDFRMGNLMIDGDGIAAILDWELAHIGDPAQDLAYICTPSWRFTRHDRAVGGFGNVDAFLAAYASASNTAVDRDRFDYWLVYSTLWWGICCLGMTQIWRSGTDRTLERVVIGRRVSEVEVDLLLLFDTILDGMADQTIDWQVPELPDHDGETHNGELLEALISWDSDDVIPEAKGRDLFQARVAKNAMGMLKRDAELGPVFATQQHARLAGLGQTEDSLGDGLADGSLSPDDPKLLAHLRLTALERLSIDQPKYPGLAAALTKWSP